MMSRSRCKTYAVGMAETIFDNLRSSGWAAETTTPSKTGSITQESVCASKYPIVSRNIELCSYDGSGGQLVMDSTIIGTACELGVGSA